jgi:hypothetical protein
MRSKQRHRGRSSARGGMRGNVANRADRKQRFRPLQLLWQQQSVCLGIRSFGRSHHRHLLCPLDTDASRRPRRQLRPDLRQVGGAGLAGGSLSGFACLSIIQRHTSVHGYRWRWPPSQRTGRPRAPTVGRLGETDRGTGIRRGGCNSRARPSYRGTPRSAVRQNRPDNGELALHTDGCRAHGSRGHVPRFKVSMSGTVIAFPGRPRIRPRPPDSGSSEGNECAGTAQTRKGAKANPDSPPSARTGLAAAESDPPTTARAAPGAGALPLQVVQVVRSTQEGVLTGSDRSF